MTPIFMDYFGDDIGPHIGAGFRVDEVISWLATRQHGVVAAWQLKDRGVSRKAIEVRREGKRLFVLHRGVYLVGHRNMTKERKLMGALLVCGRGSVLSHHSAAERWGIFRHTPDRTHVTVARADKPRRRDIRPFVQLLQPDEIRVRGGFPVTSYARTYLDLARTLPGDALARAFEHVERHPHELRNVARIAERYFGRPGAPALREMLATYVRHTGISRSTFELEFIAWLRARGIPLPELNAKLPIGDEVFMPDCLWSLARLIVELDTWDFHGFPAARARDNRRDRVLDLAGYTVFRVFPDDLVGDRGVELEQQIRTKLAVA